MLKFNASNLEDLQAEVKEREHETAIAIVKAICLALDHSVDVVEIGLIAGGNLSITAKRADFLMALQFNLERCQDAEEFELCAKAVSWMAKLSA